MITQRYTNRTTSENLDALLNLINDMNTLKVVLFATSASANGTSSPSDGPETNFPLISALVEYQIPSVEPSIIVFDGIFMMAVREPRYNEVKVILDAAEKSSHVYFSPTSAPFTSNLSPEEAAKKLQRIAPVIQFTPVTRNQYFSLLTASGASEQYLYGRKT